MGLSLCYELSLAGKTSALDVLGIVTKLHAHAATLGFEKLTPIVRVAPGEHVPPPALAFPVLTDFFELNASYISEPHDEDWYPVAPRDSQWSTAIGFAVHPGAHCEGATFGFAAPSPVESPEWPPNARVYTDWHWHCCCKTQYASTISDAHLLRCHLSLVGLLEEAARLGITIEVRDETGYWETRDTQELLKQVHDMNCIVARFAGSLHDAISPAMKVEGAIFEHPEFEHLEME
jgi:hypothetical protein